MKMTFRWGQMIVCAAAVVLLFGAGPADAPRWAFFAALAVFALSFATFCLLYEEPMNRARQRVAGQLARTPAQGLHAEEHQRLQSMAIKPNEHEKAFQLTFLSAANLASGAAGLVLLVWGIIARAM
jgi:hypothetical protein